MLIYILHINLLSINSLFINFNVYCTASFWTIFFLLYNYSVLIFELFVKNFCYHWWYLHICVYPCEIYDIWQYAIIIFIQTYHIWHSKCITANIITFTSLKCQVPSSQWIDIKCDDINSPHYTTSCTYILYICINIDKWQLHAYICIVVNAYV